MTYLKSYMNNLKRRLKIVLSSKFMLVLICALSLGASLIFTNYLADFRESDIEDYPIYDAIIYEALVGKTAVSVNIPSSMLPIELLYPGTVVDLTDISGGNLRYLARNVTLIGLSMTSRGELARLTIAVSPQQGEDILNASHGNIGLLVKGENSSDIDEIEIVEF